VEPPTTITGPPGRIDRALESSVVGSFTRIGIRLRRRIEHWEDPEGAGRRVLVTGGNSGLGFAAARSLLMHGARVLITTRDDRRGVEARRALVESVASAGGDREEIASRLEVAVLDLDLLADIDVVVHNAGAMFPTRTVTNDDLEHTYQVHVVARFLLTMLLVPQLEARPDPRVVWVASGGMYTEPLVVRRVDSPRSYRPSVAYARAKRAQVELAAELHRRLGERTGIAFHAMHPGWARTPGLESSLPGFTRIVGPLLRNPAEGADTIVHLALAPRSSPAMSGGAFWHDRRPRATDRLRRTMTTSEERTALWERLMVDAGIDRPAARS